MKEPHECAHAALLCPRRKLPKMCGGCSRLERWFPLPLCPNEDAGEVPGTVDQCRMQQCLAINDRGVSVYGSNKGYRWRMVHHILNHEQPLLSLMANNAAALSRSPYRMAACNVVVNATARSSPAANGSQASGT